MLNVLFYVCSSDLDCLLAWFSTNGGKATVWCFNVSAPRPHLDMGPHESGHYFIVWLSAHAQ